MDSREQVRAAIRAEVARQNPVEDARNSLELIAESAVRFDGEGSAGYRIIDENGDPRARFENGAASEFTIRDLVAELRAKHPSLFRAAPADSGIPDGPPEVNERETGASGDHDLAPTHDFAPTPVTSGEFAAHPAREPAMPVAAPFGQPLPVGQPLPIGHAGSPSSGLRDASTAQPASAGAPRGAPRDWLMLGAGEPRTSAPANPSDTSSSAPPRASDPQGPSRGPMRPALVSSVPPAAAAPRRAPVAGEPGRHARRRPATVAYAVLGGLAILSTGAYVALGSRAHGPDLLPKQAERTRARTPAAQPPADPVATGSLASTTAAAPKSAGPGPAEPGAITGVPEVVDTATLRLDGKLVRLVGVEWSRGGRAENLTSYLGGREVTCQPADASEFYRCKVEGRDLSQVVLYNGGGRASPNAPADLLAAENYARTERIGVWQK